MEVVELEEGCTDKVLFNFPTMSKDVPDQRLLLTKAGDHRNGGV